VASAFAGLVVHSAAELIIERFMQDGVKSAMEAKAMETLRSLGGYAPGDDIMKGFAATAAPGRRCD
jgi:hypothetical protein